ncbi:MAG: hypothetical protein NWR87_00790 [Rhodospirillales bacterium]|nr:hypothetical protein [Rhodospirillales bacterium]
MSEHSPKMHDQKKYWLDSPKNVDKLVYAIYAICAGLFLADLVYHKHPHFAVEEWFGFYGIFGFFAFFGVVMAGKFLRKLIKRDEDYYDE